MQNKRTWIICSIALNVCDASIEKRFGDYPDPFSKSVDFVLGSLDVPLPLFLELDVFGVFARPRIVPATLGGRLFKPPIASPREAPKGCVGSERA